MGRIRVSDQDEMEVGLVRLVRSRRTLVLALLVGWLRFRPRARQTVHSRGITMKMSG